MGEFFSARWRRVVRCVDPLQRIFLAEEWPAGEQYQQRSSSTDIGPVAA